MAAMAGCAGRRNKAAMTKPVPYGAKGFLRNFFDIYSGPFLRTFL